MIHLIVADPGRLNLLVQRRWTAAGLPDTHFVEIVSTVAAHRRNRACSARVSACRSAIFRRRKMGEPVELTAPG